MKNKTPERQFQKLEESLAQHEASKESILLKYSNQIAAFQKELNRRYRTSFVQKGYELAQGVWIEVLAGMKLLLEGEGSMAPAAQFRAMTRGVEDKSEKTAPKPSPGQIIFIQEGQGCVGKMKVTSLAGNKVRLEITMLKDLASSEMIIPFYITITDAQNQVIEQRRKIINGIFFKPGVPLGQYTFVMENESGEASVTMAFRPAAAS